MHGDPNRTSPIGLVRYAKQFFESALAADDKVGAKPGFEMIAPVPVMYLVGHSIELGLKAYLVAEGVNLRDLPRKYGHDLEKSFKKAKELGLLNIVKFEDSDVEGMKVLNQLYSTKQLNYFVRGAKTFPVFGCIQAFNQKLLEGVGPHVGYR